MAIACGTDGIRCEFSMASMKKKCALLNITSEMISQEYVGACTCLQNWLCYSRKSANQMLNNHYQKLNSINPVQ